VRPEPIDSTQNLLTPPEVMMEFLRRYGVGEGIPMPAALVGLAEELNMDDAESIQFGNTVFISHYSDEEPLVFMRALNVDSAQNFVDNIENYVIHIYGRGIETIVTNYEDPTITSAIKLAQSRMEKNNPDLDSEITFEKDEDQTVATIRHIKG
jgi:hypothetical protein